MTPNVRPAIERQVSKVRRRIFARELLRQLVATSVVAVAVAIVWMLVEPYLLTDPPDWLRWSVLGGALGVGAIAALLIAIARRPDVTRSALSLDEAFGLRERVVTSLSLSANDAQTSAGQALLADALTRVQGLKVGERFPLGVGRSGWLVPSAATALALVALFYDPVIQTAQGTSQDKKLSVTEKADLEKKMATLQRPKRDPLVNPDKQKSEELKKLEARLDELIRQPRDTTQQLRERVKEMTPLEDEVKKLERERSEKARMMQQQLQAKDGLTPNDNPKNGPANGFQQALSEGDMEKAKEELDKLSKKMASGEMSEKDKEQLAKQLDSIQKKLKDLSQQKNKEELLKKLADEGKLDPEALEREMQQLKKDNEKLKDLEKLAQKMSQCQQCMKAGDMESAQKALSDTMDQLDAMAREGGELDDLREQLGKMKSAKDALTSACDCDCPGGMGEGDNDGEGNGRSQNRSQGGQSNNAKGAGQGSGQRPDGEQGKIRQFDAKQNAQFNAKGQKIFDGFVPGQAFKKKSGIELAGEIKQAAQDAPEAIENQRIPKAARDMAKGYFKNLGGQAEGEKKADEKGKDEKPKQ